MTFLCELAIKYGTDKGPAPAGWGYTPFYYQELDHMRFHARKVLEIGICGERNIPNNRTGASLYMWREFFPNAEIIGVDNEPKWRVTDERIKSFIGDAYHPEFIHMLKGEIGHDFDLIVDDAVHDPIPQLVLLHDLFPLLSPNGMYAMEDVCPPKLPHGDVNHILRLAPKCMSRIVKTHKDERMLLFRPPQED